MCKRVSTVLARIRKPLRSPGIDSIDSARCNPICRTGPPAESIPGFLKSLPIPAQCETCWRKDATFTVKRFKTKLLRLGKEEKMRSMCELQPQYILYTLWICKTARRGRIL
jgi:hypothetical protein